MNKYDKWYSNIISNAQIRVNVPGTYVEKHHIVPRSLGGSDDVTNLVKLTAREHFICHWLLTKMHTGIARGKMINAMYMMQGQSTHQKRYESKITSRIYNTLRAEYAQYISKMNTGRVQPADENARQIAAQTGRTRDPFSAEWCAKLSAASSGEGNSRYGAVLSEETKKKMSIKAKGRKQSAETIAKKAAAITGSKREKILCIHCSKLIAVNGYARWHGANCKSKPQTTP